MMDKLYAPEPRKFIQLQKSRKFSSCRNLYHNFYFLGGDPYAFCKVTNMYCKLQPGAALSSGPDALANTMTNCMNYECKWIMDQFCDGGTRGKVYICNDSTPRPSPKGECIYSKIGKLRIGKGLMKIT